MNNKIYIFYSLVGLLLLISVSCNKNTSKYPTQKEIVIFPAPPDTTRVQFLTSISSSIDIEGNQSSFTKFIFGENKPKVINKPYGINIHNAKLYVCDLALKGLEIIDLENKTFDYFIPTGKGALIAPVNCFVDKNNFLYIADIQRKQIVIFDNLGNYINSIGDANDFKPSDVFVDDDKIWISNNGNGKISVYNKQSLDLLYSFPNSEKGDSNFLYSPTNIFVESNKVYVSDFGDFKIKVYTEDGKHLRSIGSYGKGLGQFVRPKGIAVDRDENLYVVDAGFENTQIFDKEGKLLMFFGGSYKGPGYMWLPAKVILDYDNLKYFEKYVDESYKLKYLIIVTNQFGPDKINIYGSVEPK